MFLKGKGSGVGCGRVRGGVGVRWGGGGVSDSEKQREVTALFFVLHAQKSDSSSKFESGFSINRILLLTLVTTAAVAPGLPVVAVSLSRRRSVT